MPNSKLRPWTEDDDAKLRSLAGQMPAAQVAEELGRSRGATLVHASKLKLSLRRHIRSAARTGADAAQTSSP